MLRNKLALSLVALSCCMVSCQEDNLDIQNQIDNLSGKVDDLNSNLDSLDQELAALKESHQNALLEKLQEMDETMAGIIAENTKLSDQYTAISDSLNSIKEEVAESDNSVYYGDLLTADNFSKYTTQGASIVTGNILVTTEDQLKQLSNLRVAGGNLHLSELMDVTLPALETVGGDLVLSSVKGSVAFDNLFTVAGSFFDNNNAEQTSLVANKLAFVSGNVEIQTNILLETVSFESLAFVRSLILNSFWAEDPEYNNYGALSSVVLSDVDVENDLTIAYGGTGTVNIGNVGGHLKLEKTKFTDINISATSLGGLEVINNGELSNLMVDNLKAVNGNIKISNNVKSSGVGNFTVSNTEGFVSFPSFSALTEIKGNINVEGNSSLTSIEAFNAVTSIEADEILFNNNGSLSVLDIFNNVTEAGVQVTQFTRTNTKLYIVEKTNWFNAFTNLAEGGDITIEIKDPAADDGGFGLFSTSVIKFEGFSAMTRATRLRLTVGDVTEFSAFNALETLSPTWDDLSYLTLAMPKSTDVSLCSISTILSKIKNNELGNSNYIVNIQEINEWGWYQNVEDQDAALDQLLSSCE
ncbi:coiled-coil domain-containing protein [Flammeovirga aprica]|uniref:Receptor L-domain domain-containing protein n=1 Tax=Flammeovirga aprica JL-4 TaxID=694437 RepID=A0A7X9RSH3_9BACT|nr:hypothetical protein [Flammeovirga aprica]NME67066.1 hypothetical protein [Flammeovirga aprica JL-4]